MTGRNAYEDKLTAQVQEWNAKIEQLKARAAQADADARIKAQEKIRELEGARKAAEEQLNEMKASGEDRWEKLKKQADDAVATVEQKLSEALDKLG